MAEYPHTGRFLMGRLRHALTHAEKQTLEELVSDVETLPDGAHLARRGEVLERSTILVEGFVARSMLVGENRAILSFHVPGDFVDLHGFALKRLDHDVISIGTVTAGYVSHHALEKLMQEQPHLTRLLWFSSLLEAAIHREWICKLEQLQAAQRVAHIFAEIWYRLEMVGLACGNQVRTPLTQAQLAEMCGITPIHMNRALGQLRQEGVAEFRRGTLFAEDRARLEAFGVFDPSYLYGNAELGMGEELTS